MKESVTKFDLEAAFKALDEIESPKAEKVRANRPALNEIFSRKSKFDALMEEYYDVSDMNELDDAKEAREAEVAQAKLARIEKIVDLDAESPEDLLPSYVGKFIMQCPQCMTLFYKNPEDIEASEEDPNTVNINEVCQHCGNEAGYTLIGKVGEATEAEAADFNQEETVDVTSTEEGEEATDELAVEEIPEDDLDVELDELDLDLDLDEEPAEEEKTEESFNTGSGEQVLTEIFNLRESVATDTKHAVATVMNKLAEDDTNTFAKTTADILDVIPDEAIDGILEEIDKKFKDFKLTVDNRKKINAATNGQVNVTDDTDTIGKLLDMLDSFEAAKKSAKLIKTLVVTLIAIIGIIEPTPIVEIIALIVAALPADVIAAVMAILNPIGLAAAGVNKLYKANKEKNTKADSTANEGLTEEADLDISADEFEKLINSPEFKKPISDTEARTMIDELSDEKEEVKESKLAEVYDDSDFLSDTIYDLFDSGKFIYGPDGAKPAATRKLSDGTYKITHPTNSTSIIVKFDLSDKTDTTLKFTANGKAFTTKDIRKAQDFILNELAAAHRKQYDIAESIEINNEVLKYAVINADGTYAGVPCTSEEEARELAAQKEGRVIVKLEPLAEDLEEGVFDKLKDRLIGGGAGKLASRNDKADWILANALEDYNNIKISPSNQLVPDEANQRFHTFVVVGYTDKYSNGKTITTAPSFNNKDLVVGKNGTQEKAHYKDADKIAKGWSMIQGNGPAFIYLAKSKEDPKAVFLCEYFQGELKNDQLEKYFKVVKDHLKGAKLMAKGGMNSTEDNSTESEVETTEQPLQDGLDAIMAGVEELQEASLEKFISDTLIESYGNVAGFRLSECAYEDNKFTVDGTIYFTSGNKRQTSYLFTEAMIKNDKIKLSGLNEKLGLDKQFTITGYTNKNKTFITESFKVVKK